MSKIITVHKDSMPIYDIRIEQNYLAFGSMLEKFNLKKGKICIVTDDNVKKHYLGEVMEYCKDYAAVVTEFTFPAGEESKNLDTVKRLYTHLIEEKIDRKDILIALGGGVVGDLTGYAAATYLRGIRFVQMPTSLLSMVDSSIGGKTGVDFDGYKNMVGAFKQPQLVYMNVATLRTLPDEQYFAGYGEIVKHGLIQSDEYLKQIIHGKDKLLNKDMDTLENIIEGSCQIKRKVVEEDPTEKGIRAILNFGHTLGHAIEKQQNFQLFHGECVALGCVTALYLSFRRNYISKEEYQMAVDCLKDFHLPVICKNLNPDEIIEMTQNDKKMENGHIKFILLKKIGQAIIDLSVSNEEMKEALEQIM